MGVARVSFVPNGADTDHSTGEIFVVLDAFGGVEHGLGSALVLGLVIMREYLLRAPGGARSPLRLEEVERLRRGARAPRRREPEAGLRAERSMLCDEE